MFPIDKVKNYQHFAKVIESETGCTVKIKVMSGKNHVHYQIYDRYDMVLGTLCVNDGDVSFAPFRASDEAKDCEYINVVHMVQAADFINLINVFNKMFVEEADADV